MLSSVYNRTHIRVLMPCQEKYFCDIYISTCNILCILSFLIRKDPKWLKETCISGSWVDLSLGWIFIWLQPKFSSQGPPTSYWNNCWQDDDALFWFWTEYLPMRWKYIFSSHLFFRPYTEILLMRDFLSAVE